MDKIPASISGVLQEHVMKHQTAGTDDGNVLAATQTYLHHQLSLAMLVMTIFVILGSDHTVEMDFTLLIPSGMEWDVAPPVLAVPLTTLHGLPRIFPLPQLMI